jgi:hypothetical protein
MRASKALSTMQGSNNQRSIGSLCHEFLYCILYLFCILYFVSVFCSVCFEIYVHELLRPLAPTGDFKIVVGSVGGGTCTFIGGGGLGL